MKLSVVQNSFGAKSRENFRLRATTSSNVKGFLNGAGMGNGSSTGELTIKKIWKKSYIFSCDMMEREEFPSLGPGLELLPVEDPEPCRSERWRYRSCLVCGAISVSTTSSLD